MKHVLITGAYGGMGYQTVKEFARQGFTVFALDKKVKNPENKVKPYAINAVSNNILPAPLPKSAMAGIIRPTMMSGMANVRKLPNKPLNVTKIRAIASGRNCPNNTPKATAIRTCTNSVGFFSFIFLIFVSQNYTKNIINVYLRPTKELTVQYNNL